MKMKFFAWINGSLPQPEVPVRVSGETDEAFALRRHEFLEKSNAYQEQNWRLVNRNLRAAVVFTLLSVVLMMISMLMIVLLASTFVLLVYAWISFRREERKGKK